MSFTACARTACLASSADSSFCASRNLGVRLKGLAFNFASAKPAPLSTISLILDGALVTVTEPRGAGGSNVTVPYGPDISLGSLVFVDSLTGTLSYVTVS